MRLRRSDRAPEYEAQGLFALPSPRNEQADRRAGPARAGRAPGPEPGRAGPGRAGPGPGRTPSLAGPGTGGPGPGTGRAGPGSAGRARAGHWPGRRTLGRQADITGRQTGPTRTLADTNEH